MSKHMTRKEAKAALQALLRQEIERLRQIESHRLVATENIGRLTLCIELLEYPCECVCLNRVIGIFNMGDQAKAGRVGLSMGPVGDTLSALKACPRCAGTGKPSDLELT